MGDESVAVSVQLLGFPHASPCSMLACRIGGLEGTEKRRIGATAVVASGGEISGYRPQATSRYASGRRHFGRRGNLPVAAERPARLAVQETVAAVEAVLRDASLIAARRDCARAMAARARAAVCDRCE